MTGILGARRTVSIDALITGKTRAASDMRYADAALSPVAVCMALTALGLALRLYHLGELPAWRDETVVYWLGEESLARIWSRELALTGTHPPLFYTIHYFWNHLLIWLAIAPSAATIRLPGVLIGTASVSLFYGLLGRCFGDRVAAIGAAFLAASPAFVEFARTAKSEVLVVFCLILTLGFTVRLVDRLEQVAPGGGGMPAEWRQKRFLALAAGYVLSAIALLHAHSVGCIGLFFPSLLFATRLFAERLRWSAVLTWIALNVMVVAVFVPWLVLLAEIAHANTGYFWLKPIGIREAATIFSHVIIGEYRSEGMAGDLPLPLLLGAMMLAASLITIGCVQASQGDTRRRGIAVALIALPVLVFAISQLKPVFWEYILNSFALPLMALLVGFALEAPRISRVGHAVIIALLVSFLLPGEREVYRGEPEPWNDVAGYLASHVTAGDPILFSPTHAEWSVRFYWQPDTTAWRSLDFGPNLAFAPLRTVPSIPAAAVAGFVRDARRVWLVTDEKLLPSEFSLPAVRDALTMRFPLVTRQTFADGLRVYGYSRDAPVALGPSP